MDHSESRFAFGENWHRFLSSLNERRIAEAERAMTAMLGDIRGKTFLDVGCGSGLHSLIAQRLGANVRAFDYDPQSVVCSREVQHRYGGKWPVEEGSALDTTYLSSLGAFDIVYSWGVLHHTGDMWKALENMVPLVNERLFIAIYNDAGRKSRAWKVVKRLYNKGLKWPILIPATVYLHGPAAIRDFFVGTPFKTWRSYGERGMSAWTDVVDWVGGYPYEYARPEEIFSFYRGRGFALERLRTDRGLGCNEFVFRR